MTAPAEGGRANEAVCALLAKSLGVPPSAVTLVSGHTARWKRLAVRGEAQRLLARGTALIGD